MTKREVAILACRVLSIFALIHAVTKVPEVMYALAGLVMDTTNWIGLLLSILGPAVLVVLAVFLWKRAGILAAWIFGYDIQDEPDEPDSIVVHATMADVTATVLSLIGVWLAAHAVISVVSLAVNHLLSLQSAGHVEWWSINVGSALAGQVTQILLSIWLIFGSRSIVGWLKRAKNVGLANDQSRSAASAPPPDND